MMNDVAGGSHTNNGRLAKTFRSGLPDDTTFRLKTGMSIDDLEQWLKRIEGKLDEISKLEIRVVKMELNQRWYIWLMAGVASLLCALLLEATPLIVEHYWK